MAGVGDAVGGGGRRHWVVGEDVGGRGSSVGMRGLLARILREVGIPRHVLDGGLGEGLAVRQLDGLAVFLRRVVAVHHGHSEAEPRREVCRRGVRVDWGRVRGEEACLRAEEGWRRREALREGERRVWTRWWWRRWRRRRL